MPERASILIKGARVVDPGSGANGPAALTITGGVISSCGSEQPRADRVIDAAGLLVVPGLIDMHVHLREPGGEQRETIETGTAAAVAGGFSAVGCMPNTVPPADTPEIVTGILQKAQEIGSCHVYPVACLSKGRAGKELADFRALADAGAVAFSDDGDGLADNVLMASAFKALAALDRPAIQHCEDPTFTRGVMHEGEVSSDLGLPGLSPLAEEFMIARDLALAEAHDARYHIAHISTGRAVELVRAAKAGRARVTTEVCPHHLLLTDEACRTKDTNFKMHPPLRPQRDVDACVAGVVDGTIDMLVTDHAPHVAEEKARGFLEAPPGIVGLETSLALFAKALIEPGHIEWYKLIELMSTAPARIFGLPGGSLAVGSPADVTL
ncbi:MAG: dihydroorotase, partial [Planctomycetes bacterium]|nr:dihydroorotase [Planctomycetota bacterium]